MLELLWLAALVGPLLVGLGIGLYVLRNIVRDAADHEPTHPDADAKPDFDSPRHVCSNCQTRNEPGFIYCSECAAKL
jgi:hypothetical protein